MNSTPTGATPRQSDGAAAEAQPAGDPLLAELWAWHRGLPTQSRGGGAGDLLPALLQPLGDPASLRHSYPLVLLERGGPPAAPLADLLEQWAGQLAGGEDETRLVRENLVRLERQLRQRLGSEDRPVEAGPYLQKAAADLEEQLHLRGESAAQLHRQLGELLSAVPQGARLLPLCEQAPLELLLHCLRQRSAEQQAAMRREIGALADELRNLLRVDDDKSDRGRSAQARQKSLDPLGAARLDPAALARVLGPARGSAALDKARRERIEEMLGVLEKAASAPPARAAVVVQPKDRPAPEGDGVTCKSVEAGQVCQQAAEIFDEQVGEYARLFAAMRVARLEIEGQYDPPRHDALLASFDWTSFSGAELTRLPAVVAVVPGTDAVGSGLASLSTLLLSRRPVQVLVPTRPAESADSAGQRLEPGYFGISLRTAMINQSSVARPGHLLEGFCRAVDAAGPAMHVVAGGQPLGVESPRLGAYLHASAAVEGRAHPLLRYDPAAGRSWAERLDFAGNPAADADWPAYPRPGSEHRNGDAATEPFTFADFCLLEPRMQHHFRPLPAGDFDALTPLAAYLRLSDADAAERLPFIEAADAEGERHRLLVDRELVAACRDRLDYWHTLQELAGIDNDYVRLALEAQQAELEAAHAAELAEREQAWRDEVETVRSETAREALEKLARGLVNADFTAAAMPAADAPAAPAAPAPAEPARDEADEPAAESEAPAAEEADEDDEPQEPWIQSALCTSCNDCINLNPQLFVYNASKQAVIGDPAAGTFAQLVEAAEKCPSRCIHPGTPLNPDEPNLDELIERAKPFQ